MMANDQFTRLVRQYIDMVYRVAFNYIKSTADAEDITQNVFLKLIQEKKHFENDEHVKYWLIRVTVNECRNLVRSRWWKTEPLEDYAASVPFDDRVESELFSSVMALPRKYRIPIYLYYYEGYSTQEIGRILKLPKNTVCTQLKRGRALLKKTLEGGTEDV